MQINSFNVRPANIGFKGTKDPQTPGEEIHRQLRDMYYVGKIDATREGRLQNQGNYNAKSARIYIANIIKQAGDMTCRELGKLIAEPVHDDLPIDY